MELDAEDFPSGTTQECHISLLIAVPVLRGTVHDIIRALQEITLPLSLYCSDILQPI